MDRIDHYAVPRRLCGSGWRRHAVCGIQETLVVARIVLLVEPGGKTKVGQFDVPVFVN